MLGLQLAVNQSEPSNALLYITYRGLPNGQSGSCGGSKEMTVARDP